MNVVGLYNNVYTTIVGDRELNELVGLTETSSLLDKARKFSKRAKPPNLIDNVPLIAFYAHPGGQDRNNSEVYYAPIVFNIYTNDDVDKAHRISTRLIEIFHKENLPFCGMDSFESRVLNSYESLVDVENVYCYTTVIRFSVTFG